VDAPAQIDVDSYERPADHARRKRWQGAQFRPIGPGWLVLPPHLLDDVLRATFVDDIATEAPGQLTLARFIEAGGLAGHPRRVRPRYRARRVLWE
jgi:hypothetical protein